MPNATREDWAEEDRLELVLHLQQSRSTHSPDAAAARARAQVLIKDILGTRLGVEAEADGENYLRAHGFSDLGKALAATRALQHAFEGFRTASSAGRPNISLVLDSFSEEEAHNSYTSPSVEQKDLLRLAKSSQVLITQALYDRIGPCQPLALRSFPPRAGVYEFLWTSVERLDELRAEAESVPALVDPTPTPSGGETIIQRPPVEAPPPTSRYPLPPPVAEPTYTSLNREAVAEEPPPRRSHWRVIAVSAVATTLVSVGLVIGPRYFSNRLPKTPMTEVQPPSEQAPPPTSGPLEPPAPTIPPSSQPDPTPGTVPEPKPQAPPQPVSHAPKKQADSGQCPFSIPNALHYAGKYRDQHRYDEAEQEYKRVLDCDHNNPEARDGLARTKMEKSGN
jgi:hypothetical protein